MPPRKLTPQTPGEPVKDEAPMAPVAETPEPVTEPAAVEQSTPEAVAEAAENLGQATTDAPEAPTVTETPPVVADAPIETALLAELSRRPDALPDASEVDPATIKRATLTAQGWVVPAPKSENT